MRESATDPLLAALSCLVTVSVSLNSFRLAACTCLARVKPQEGMVSGLVPGAGSLAGKKGNAKCPQSRRGQQCLLSGRWTCKREGALWARLGAQRACHWLLPGLLGWVVFREVKRH